MQNARSDADSILLGEKQIKGVPNLTYDLISNIEDLPDNLVNVLAPDHNLLVGQQFSRVLEKSLDGIKVRYIVLKSDSNPLALVYLVETQVKLFSLKLGPIHLPLSIKLAICGNPIICADCGISARNKRLRNMLLPEILKILNKVLKELRVSVVLLKDISAPKTAITAAGYFQLPLEPSMGISGTDRWQDFSDYLSEMDKDQRRKIRSARKKLEREDITIVVETDIQNITGRLHELYSNVARRINSDQHKLRISYLLNPSRAWGDLKTFCKKLPDFLTNLPRRLRARELNKDFFYLLHESFRESADIISLRTRDEIVAFTINFEENKVYYSLFTGMQYGGDIHSVYRTLISSKIERAIARQVNRIEFGKTGAVTKAELGARQRALPCYGHDRPSLLYILKSFRTLDSGKSPRCRNTYTQCFSLWELCNK